MCKRHTAYYRQVVAQMSVCVISLVELVHSIEHGLVSRAEASCSIAMMRSSEQQQGLIRSLAYLL